MLRIAPTTKPGQAAAVPPSGPPAGLPPQLLQALQGGAGGPPPPGPPPTEAAGTPPEADPTVSPDDSSGCGVVPPDVARYMDPSMGPFKCSNCKFFDADHSDCQVITGKVDPEGLCIMFVKGGASTDDSGADPSVPPPGAGGPPPEVAPS